MLEAKKLKKIYKTKKGVSVEALKGVSIQFPEKGMVFLLGKSGSGKSTLLNLLGGLDKYDDGEIVIQGVSSKEFHQSHFDSYRNTYVGFIFQEYNVLEDFTVGANIALAIELQGRKAEDEEINRILKEVDLEGFGDRKPNELSGGQKQRVAIARALVKNPQIIMADEPTGALDSKTGKQVFDTLKKLSKEKLVVVVSHDREFAEYYGDRIIELADGNVLSDMERKSDTEAKEQENGIVFGENQFVITKNYHLTEEDRKRINDYLSGKETDIKAVVKDKGQIGFEKTDESKIVPKKGNFKLIKSKLPLKNAFKIGASSLKHKKFRLAITIILSFAAFSMFALADTFGNYDHVKTCTNSIADTKISYASVLKSKYIDQGSFGYWDDWSYKLSKEDVEKITKDTGVEYKGVYVPSEGQPLLENYDVDVPLTEREDGELYPTYFSGYMEITAGDLKEMEYDMVAGRIPRGDKEVAISEYMFKTFEKAGYVDKTGKKTQIKSYEDMIGKQIKIGETEYTVAGIIDTKVDFDRYESIIENPAGKSSAELLTGYALSQELQRIKDYSMSCVAMLGEGQLDRIREKDSSALAMSNFWMDVSNSNYTAQANYIDKLSNYDASKITWIDGEKKALGDKEILISKKALYNARGNMEEALSQKDAIKYLENHPEFTMMYQKYADSNETSEKGWQIVGIVDTEEAVYVLPDELYNILGSDMNGEYAFAVATMPKEKSEIRDLVEYCYTSTDNVKYKMQNSVTWELDTVDEALKVLSKVFLYVGLGFAVFAAIMLSNFIATSISYKKQEIGILRAIGARSNDVFKIFFSESFMIALMNFVLSVITTVIITAIINGVLREEVGILITILNFGFRQLALLFVISVAVAAVASFIPVYRIASKKPIEAIRNR